MTYQDLEELLFKVRNWKPELIIHKYDSYVENLSHILFDVKFDEGYMYIELNSAYETICLRLTDRSRRKVIDKFPSVDFRKDSTKQYFRRIYIDKVALLSTRLTNNEKLTWMDFSNLEELILGFIQEAVKWMTLEELLGEAVVLDLSNESPYIKSRQLFDDNIPDIYMLKYLCPGSWEKMAIDRTICKLIDGKLTFLENNTIRFTGWCIVDEENVKFDNLYAVFKWANKYVRNMEELIEYRRSLMVAIYNLITD